MRTTKSNRTPTRQNRVAGTRLFRISYWVGAKAIRVVKSYARIFWRKTKPIRRLFGRFVNWLKPPVLVVTNELGRLANHFATAAKLVYHTAKTEPKRLGSVLASLPKRAYQTHTPLVRGLMNVTMPLCAVAVLLATLQYWHSLNYALSVEYDGKMIGYIADESVYDAAVEIAAGRVVNVDDSFQIERTPKLTIAMASSSELMDENETCDAILRTAGSAVAEAYGLYIDGELTAVLPSEVTINRVLKELLAPHEPEAENERAEFVSNIEIVEGLYPAQSAISVFALRDILNQTHEQAIDYTVQSGDTFTKIADAYDMDVEELKDLNAEISKLTAGKTITVIKSVPFLQVKIVRTIEYEDKVPYNTQYINDESYYLGYEKVKVSGRQGESNVVAEVDLVDGVEQGRTIIERHITVEPVDRVVIVGAKVYQEGTVIGDGVSTGTFVWPVPGCTNIYWGFGYRDGAYHAGIDVSDGNTYGLPIIASDGGTVTALNNTGRGSYGMYVLIDHGNGYQTMYAHCSSVSVSVGQKVAQGEVIGRVGNTGYSTGPHLHFEIRVDGVHVDPRPFVDGKK